VSRLEVAVRCRVAGFVLDAALDADGVVAVVGPNGAGKTTLLLAILGVVRPEAGRVVLGDRVLHDGAASVPTEDRRIAYVPQDYGLFPHLTARQNVEFALGCRPGRGRELATALLERMGARSYGERRPAALSGGERQRVALARALATEPRALLFDEPFAALDVTARAEVRRSLGQWLRELGLPAVIVTHDPADVAELDVPAVVLAGGKVVQRGTLAQLRAAPATDYVARFAGG
jgi:molybdate transport system ATP-binding protein